MSKIIFIFLLSLSPLSLIGQESISDWIETTELKNTGIKTIELFKLETKGERLIERVNINSNGLIKKTTSYSRYSSLSESNIESEIFEYDHSDTLLISRRYENNNGDTLRHFKYTYNFDSIGRISQKWTEDIDYNDFEQEEFFFNTSGYLIRERINFYNNHMDSIRHYIDRIYKYDKSGNCISKSFAPSGIVEFERIYEYDSDNNLLNFKTIGMHQGGEDIDRYTITYNSFSQKILKEIWDASGENWAYIYEYDKTGKLIKQTRGFRPIKRKYLCKKGSERPPPPPFYPQDMLKKKYKNESEYKLVYDSNKRLIEITDLSITLKFERKYIIKYK